MRTGIPIDRGQFIPVHRGQHSGDRGQRLGGGRTELAIMCAAFVLGLISHLVGLSMEKTVNRFRVGGVVVTAAVRLALGARLMRIAISYLVQ